MNLVAQGLAVALSPSARRFRQALRDPARAQARVLADLVDNLAGTDYGRFLRIRTAGDFLDRVPVVSYEDVESWIDAQARGRGEVLTREKTLFYEPTSGSSGARKKIPYTASLRSSFSHAFAVWAHDMLRHGPPLGRGKLYFSVSPKVVGKDDTDLGLEDDRDYLAPSLRVLLSPFWVDPGDVAKARDGETFRRRAAELLLREAKLEVVSVWNPTFFLVLLGYIAEHAPVLVRELGIGGSRADALLADEIVWREVWPRLALISCWDSGTARAPASQLHTLFPGVCVQGKGLLATEAPITVPMFEAGGAVPMLDEVYLELRDDDGNLHPLHHAEQDGEYEVILSQRGGLYRYRLGDRVRVGKRYLGTPTLEFLGRAGGVSDLVGEKLQERYVRGALAEAGLPGDVFGCLVPCREPRDHYTLVVERDVGLDERALDLALRGAHHYDLARELEQLGPVQVQVRRDAASVLWDHEVRRGVAAGDVKHRTLLTGVPDAEFCAWLSEQVGSTQALSTGAGAAW